MDGCSPSEVSLTTNAYGAPVVTYAYAPGMDGEPVRRFGGQGGMIWGGAF
jgi:hypothetical protein